MKSIFFILIAFCSISIVFGKDKLITISPENSHIVYLGRFDFSTPGKAGFSWPGVSINAKFEGKVCNVLLNDLGDDQDHNFYNIFIDDFAPVVIEAKEKEGIYKIDTLKEGVHTITIFKRTESVVGKGEFLGFQIEKGKTLLPLERKQRKIEFIGNSITCGYGIEGENKECKFSPKTENNYLAYGAITARNLKCEYVANAFSGIGIYQNYDMNRENTMPNLYTKIIPFEEKEWDFSKWKPDVVVINLGTNDFAHSNPDSIGWSNAYLKLLSTIRKNYPDAEIICLIGPMISDYWPESSKALTTIKKYLAAVKEEFKKTHDAKISTFNLSPQGNLGYGCDWHPSLKQQKKNSDELTTYIKSRMGW